jgi:hypothetical protein
MTWTQIDLVNILTRHIVLGKNEHMLCPCGQ